MSIKKRDNQTESLKSNADSLEERNNGVASAMPPTQLFVSKVPKEEEQVQSQKGTAANDQATATSKTNKLPDEVQLKMEQTMGHDFSNVQIHEDSSKAAELGALAFAQGDDIHFASGQYDPSSKKGQELIGHEFAHVAQQREGKVQPTETLKKGVAINDDSSLEKEADQLGAQAANADASQQKTSLKSGTSSTQNPVQRYTDIEKSKQKTDEWDMGSDARVANNGQTATSNDYAHVSFAEKGLIEQSNKTLASKKSGITIKPGAKTVKGTAPDGSAKRTLHEVEPTISVSASSSGTQDFWADCGRSSREVMGPTTTDKSPAGVYKDNKGNLNTTKNSKNPANFRDEILISAGLGKDAKSARKAYLALSVSEREKFDKKHQINKYANPDVGEAFVSRRDDDSTKKGFNFHWGGVIMNPGHDKVSLENFAKPGTTYDTKDEDWYFETYGPPTKKGQTFHEKNEGSVGEKGKNNTTMAASTAGLSGKTNQEGVHFVKDPSKYSSTLIGKLAKDTKVTIMKRGSNWYEVRVEEGKHKGKSGWIMKNYFNF